MSEYIFEAEIIKHEGMDAAYVMFPYNVEEQFGTKRQVKVKAIFDGVVEYRGSLANMGEGGHCLGLTKKIREQLGKQSGEIIQVSLHVDNEPCVVQVPADLQAELAQQHAESAFNLLSYTNQKRIVASIEAAKKSETRLKRITAAIDELRGKQL